MSYYLLFKSCHHTTGPTGPKANINKREFETLVPTVCAVHHQVEDAGITHSSTERSPGEVLPLPQPCEKLPPMPGEQRDVNLRLRKELFSDSMCSIVLQ